MYMSGCSVVFADVKMEFKKNPNWRGLSQKFSCGVGHVINDVTRRMLQTFRMIFLMRVVGISATYAGLIALYTLFTGAVIFAPVAGFLCDKVKIPVLSRKHGKKKSWHLFGTIATAIGLPLFFSKCLVCGNGTSEWVVLLYYFLIATVLSFSMNFIDISHLSIIPVLAKDQSKATELTALRTGFMYLTGIVSYLVAWLILGQGRRDLLTKESSMDFLVITLILTAVGLVCSAIFHFGTKEPSEDSKDKALPESTADSMTEGSFIPSPVVFQSLAYFGIYQQREKNIGDRVIHSLRLSEEETCPVREKIFSRTFFEAKEISEIKIVGKEERDAKRNMPVVSMTVKSEDDLTFVKALPKERKISPMMSIFDKMMTKEKDSKEENDAKPDNVRPIHNISEEDGQGIMENGQQKSKVYNQGQKRTSGVDNEGFDPNETQLNSQHFPDVSQDEGKALPSASDVKSAHPPRPKTVRCWLKDPHLYKGEIHTRQHMNSVFVNEMCLTDHDPDYGISKRNLTLLLVRVILIVMVDQLPGYSSILLSLLPPSLSVSQLSRETVEERERQRDRQTDRLTDRQTDRRTDRQTDRLTERQTDRQVDRQTDRQTDRQEAIASLPLILLVSATLSTQISRKLSGKVGNQWSFIVAALTVIGSCLWFMRITQSTRVFTYPAVVLLGFGSSAMFVNALSFATELIGENKASSGLVFSVVGIISNLTSGTLYLVIQVLFPKGSAVVIGLFFSSPHLNPSSLPGSWLNPVQLNILPAFHGV
ncbi:Major facilitator superfamily domain-containing protein 12 [Stylophora pistillata]|uniref:Major facilitator superfamily domain-containing protein 12 n=1 Tax=Stylophora pistillata TaxID=50429 RepID=A0A2B4SH43_STYPI|nr:Major facilitator superfamily domain-containing protein 12 [Stylophora pistillata]